VILTQLCAQVAGPPVIVLFALFDALYDAAANYDAQILALPSSMNNSLMIISVWTACRCWW
jgi:hypothetical protein